MHTLPSYNDRFTVSIDQLDGITVLRLRGDLTVHQAERLHALTRGALARSRGLIVAEMSQLRYIGAVGVGVLIDLHRRVCARGGRVALAQAPAQVRDVLRLTRVDTVLPVWDTINQAVAAEREMPVAC